MRGLFAFSAGAGLVKHGEDDEVGGFGCSQVRYTYVVIPDYTQTFSCVSLRNGKGPPSAC